MALDAGKYESVVHLSRHRTCPFEARASSVVIGGHRLVKGADPELRLCFAANIP
jgi:hypothetical protein